MKKLVLSLVFLVTILISLSNRVEASYVYDVDVGDAIKLVSFNNLTGAGALELRKDATGFQWVSFCLEKNQTIPVNQNVYIGSISNYAIPGGGGAGPSGDPISDYTAWLFMSSELGTLPNYDGGMFDSADLQKRIWLNENEISSTTYYDETSVILWYTTFAASGWYNDGIVKVLNLYKDTGFTIHVQDQLILGTKTVPEPSTVVLFCAGLLGITLISRKKKN